MYSNESNFDIVVLWYLADTRLLSALINAFYTSTTVIDFLLWTLKIKYVILFFTFYVGDPHIHPHISDLLESRYTATKLIFDIVVLWYLADTRLLSALINAFYTSTTVIDFLLWTLKIKYVILFFTFYVGDPHIHPHISDLLDSRYTATKSIFDIVVLWYLADTCLLSALINAFYTSTTVIDFLLWTLKIKYVILFFIFYVGDDENTRADLMNLFLKWRHVRQNDIKCLRPLTDSWQHHWRISDWRMSITGC